MVTVLQNHILFFYKWIHLNIVVFILQVVSEYQLLTYQTYGLLNKFVSILMIGDLY